MRYLEDVITNAIDDLETWVKENPGDDPDYNGTLQEIADGAVPVYTHALLQMAADNNRLATNEPETGSAFDGNPTPVNIIAANVYGEIADALADRWSEIQAEGDDDE